MFILPTVTLMTILPRSGNSFYRNTLVTASYSARACIYPRSILRLPRFAKFTSSYKCSFPAYLSQPTWTISSPARIRTMATITGVQEYRLKTASSPSEIKNGSKVEVEVEGVEGGKVLLLKVNGAYKALGTKCTRKSTSNSQNMQFV